MAEDLVSETFTKHWRIYKIQVEDRSFACWLYTIARNQIVDTFRKSKPVILDESWAEGSCPGNDEEKVMQEDIKNELMVVYTLSQDQQDALLLRFQEGLKIKEIAQVMNEMKVLSRRSYFEG